MSDEAVTADHRMNIDPLKEWVEKTLPRALAFARSLLRDGHAAEDVVQDCYGRLWQHRERYNLVQDGWKLLLRSITHACIDRSRRNGRMTNAEPQVIEDPSVGAARNGRFPDPVQSAEAGELHHAIGVAMSQLSVPQRVALELRALGTEIPEIAATLEVSENHAAVLIHRARKNMKERLAKFLEAERIPSATTSNPHRDSSQSPAALTPETDF